MREVAGRTSGDRLHRGEHHALRAACAVRIPEQRVGLGVEKKLPMRLARGCAELKPVRREYSVCYARTNDETEIGGPHAQTISCAGAEVLNPVRGRCILPQHE